MTFKHLWLSAAIPSSLIMLSMPAVAQTTVDADTNDSVTTSTAGDVTVNSNVNIRPTNGSGITVDSDNTVTNNGNVIFNNVDNVTGIELQGGNTGELTHTGNIQLVEDFSNTDTDDDNVVDGPFAQGTGRTGILISGASPFAGNITLSGSSTVTVEGNDSYGIRIANGSGLIGTLAQGGAVNMLGDNSRGISLESGVTGNVTLPGSIRMQGQNSSAIVTEAGITGQMNLSGTITNTGYRFTSRPTLSGRNLLGAEDLLQAGSAVQIGGNVSNGILLERVVTTTTADDGTVTETVQRTSNISQLGEAPAFLIDGNGTPIAIGLVATITDPANADFNAEHQYAFVQQGTLRASGVYDDVNATVFEVREATLTGGINNSGTMQSVTYRSGDDGTADVAGRTGAARVIVLGDQAIADRINNTGIIIAQVNEATDEIYADRTNVVAARNVSAVAIDIAANARLTELINTNTITALVTARNGEAIAIRDASGTLTMINNSGTISAGGVNSDAQNLQAVNFNTVALDLSANTSGVTINQTVPVDTDTTDDVTPADPAIVGGIRLGSGDDTLSVQAGSVTGDLSFGDGADVLALSGGADYSGGLTDSDGRLTITAGDGSVLTNNNSAALGVTSASFESGSTYRPTLDGATGQASTLTASGDITFANGATIAPILNNVINSTNTTFTVLDAAGTLNFGGTVDNLSGSSSPFMYDTTFGLDPNDPNALVITLDLRSTEAMGLDAIQTASFATAFDAMQNNSGMANAFVNISNGTEFRSALSQLLPEFSAAARQFVIANVDGAVGAVGTHLDNARNSQAKPGGVWLQQFTYFADRELTGLAQQYRGHGFGFTGGIDTAFGPFHTAGINVGFASTEIEDPVGFDDPMDVTTFQLGTYAGYASGNFGLEAYAGGGFNDFSSTRKIRVGSYSSDATGDWSGNHMNAALRAGYHVGLTDRFWVRPAVSVDYLRLKEDAYSETGDVGVALAVDARTSEVGSATAMLNIGATFDGKRTWLRPALRLGYKNEFMNDGVVTGYRFVGLNTPASLTAAEFPNSGFLVGFSLAAGSNYSSFGFDFDSDIRDGFIRHTGRIVIRLIF